MKTKLLAAAGVALIVGIAYYFTRRKSTTLETTPQALPQTENERHHLTQAFSKAKRVALGN